MATYTPTTGPLSIDELRREVRFRRKAIRAAKKRIHNATALVAELELGLPALEAELARLTTAGGQA